MNGSLRKVVRSVTPAPVRRNGRVAVAKLRNVAAYGAFRRSPTLAIRYLLLDHELDNFTYPISNAAELAAFIADALGVEAAAARSYIDELETDVELARAVRSRLATRRDRNRSMPFGRRLGWYAIARLRRPSLIVETGVHDGLGSTALLRALERNAADGFPGELVSIDTRPKVGWLIPTWLRDDHHLVIGDAMVELSNAIAGRPVDMFIHDSDHRYAHETAEFEMIAPLAGPGAVLLSDNAHASSAFSDFCERHGLAYRFWHEIPRRHFYPGAGIGFAVTAGSLERTPVDPVASPRPGTSRVDRLYAEIQSDGPVDVPASDDELAPLADNWKDAELPELQRRIADVQLVDLAKGVVDPVFAALAKALKRVDAPRFSLLDAACASGYYSEVIRVLDPRAIDYAGCDYSPSMVDSARAHYPGVPFSVEDLTGLSQADRSFDVVLLAGVLEHVPDYPRAIHEAGRVAARYLIVHRCPTTTGPAHERTIGTQYNIRTPRTYFSLARLTAEVADAGFELIDSIDVYPKSPGRARPDTHRTLTLVFSRRGSGLADPR